MAPARVIYSITRYWRCYILLTIASLLSFVLVYIAQTDPQLEYYFPYFKLGSKYYYYFYANGAAEDMHKLMENTTLDYEFMHSNSRYCMINENLNYEGFADLNANDDSFNGENDNHVKLLMLSVSQVSNFKYRQAARQTWLKQIDRNHIKVLFIVGNANYDAQNGESTVVSGGGGTSKAALNDQAKLKEEIKEFGDLIQINMPDNENFTSTKSLIAIKWAISYCPMAKYLYLLSDSAVVNHNLLNNFVVKKLIDESSKVKTVNNEQVYLNDSVIVGNCNYTDEKLAVALKLFFKDHKNEMKKQKGEKDDEEENGTDNKRAKSDEKIKKLKKKSNVSKEIGNASDNGGGGGKRNSNNEASSNYKGQYCSNLGWLLSVNAARKLWITALRSPYMMRILPAYLNGYIAFKANLKHINLFEYEDFMPVNSNCLKVFQQYQNKLLCAENFTMHNRFSSYIATWNVASQSQVVLPKQ